MITGTAERRRIALICAGIAALAVVAYAGTIPAGFVYDDRRAVSENPVINGHLPLLEAFDRDHWGLPGHESVARMYRPAEVIWLGLDWRMTGGNSHLMHGLQVLWHTLFIVLAFLVWRRLVGDWVAGVACALCAVLAAQSEAVEILVGRSDVTVALCAVVGLWAHRRPGALGWLTATGALALAVFSKESGVVLPVAWLFVGLAFPAALPRPALAARLTGYGAIAMAYVALRWRAFGAGFWPYISPLVNPLGDAPAAGRIFGAASIIARHYARALVDPGHHLYDCSYRMCMPSGPADPFAWLGLALVAAFGALALLGVRRFPRAAAGLGWFGILFLPASNLITANGSVYGERWLYGPALGLCLAAAAGLNVLRARLGRRGLVPALIAAAVLANALALQWRHLDWRSERSLFLSGVESAPLSAVAHSNLAADYLSTRELDLAAVEAERAIALDPSFLRPRLVRAEALERLGQTSAAAAGFREAMEVAPSEDSFEACARFYARQGELAEARAVTQEGLRRWSGSSRLRALEALLTEDLSK